MQEMGCERSSSLVLVASCSESLAMRSLFRERSDTKRSRRVHLRVWSVVTPTPLDTSSRGAFDPELILLGRASHFFGRLITRPLSARFFS
jgi:hypothetical protein